MNSSLTTTGHQMQDSSKTTEVAEFGLIGETAHQIDENVKLKTSTNLKIFIYLY